MRCRKSRDSPKTTQVARVELGFYLDSLALEKLPITTVNVIRLYVCSHSCMCLE